MNERILVRVGIIGAAATAICCATPILGVILGALGLAAWAAGADYVLLPLMALSLALVVFGLLRRSRAGTAGGNSCCIMPTDKKGERR